MNTPLRQRSQIGIATILRIILKDVEFVLLLGHFAAADDRLGQGTIEKVLLLRVVLVHQRPIVHVKDVIGLLAFLHQAPAFGVEFQLLYFVDFFFVEGLG